MRSKRRSSASAASTAALDAPDARVTNTTRAASPLLATRMLLSPAPATVALVARESDGTPTARRKIHHVTALAPSVMKFASVAMSRMGQEAVRIAAHAVAQSMVRPYRITAVSIAIDRIHRIACFTAGFTTRLRDVARAVSRRGVRCEWHRV